MTLAILQAGALPPDESKANHYPTARDDAQGTYEQLDLGILLGEGGFFSPPRAATPRSFQLHAGLGNALVSITQSQAEPGAAGLINSSYNGLVPASGTSAGFIVFADSPGTRQFVITAETLGMPDPVLALFEITQDGSIERAANDNCTEDLSGLVGRDFRNSVNACLNVTLPTGLYFVTVNDVGGADGDALISITQPSGSTPALLNLSYNGLVEMAGIRLGFIVNSEHTFALTAESLGLPDTAMTLYQIMSAGEKIIASNDNCDLDLTAHAGRDFRNSDNACLLSTLEPGLYFVEITGSDASTGGCVDIAGAWEGTETVALSCTADGDTFTDTQRGSGTIVIQQNGCNISYHMPGLGVTRTGTVNGNQMSVSGPFAVALVPGTMFSRNEAIAEGMVDGDQMTLTGSGVANGSVNGETFSCSGNSEANFSRLNSSGASCAEVAGTYRGTYTSDYCDGERYSGRFNATVDAQTCAIEFITSEGTLGAGIVTGNTFKFGTTDLECGVITGKGTVNSNAISGSYGFSLGGSGSFSGVKQ